MRLCGVSPPVVAFKEVLRPTLSLTTSSISVTIALGRLENHALGRPCDGLSRLSKSVPRLGRSKISVGDMAASSGISRGRPNLCGVRDLGRKPSPAKRRASVMRYIPADPQDIMAALRTTPAANGRQARAEGTKGMNGRSRRKQVK